MTKKRMMILGIVTALAVAPAVPAQAGGGSGSDTTRGQFTTLPGGIDLGYDIDGNAIMVRFDDETHVAVGVTGLDASSTYPTHVHNAPCSAAPPGGGHYQHVVGGPVDTVNEMWPTVATNSNGKGRGFAEHGYRARPDAQSIVIHYPADTSIRLACADLS